MQSVLMLWELVVFAFLPTFGEPVTENGKEPAPARPDFEAAFQGECATASICEQKCANLHDGTFECDCHLGYALHTNGYSCHRVNVTRQTEGPVGQKMRRSDRNPSLQRAGGSLLDTHGFVIHDLYGLSVSRAGLVERLVVRDRDPSRLSTRNPLEGNYCTGDPDCSGSGKCVRDPDADLERCVCDLGYIGHRCEQSVTISEPKFSGKSWLQFPVLREAYETLNIVLEFLPHEPDAVLFLSGEKEDFAGDFFSISLVGGVVEIRMDCGSGFGVVKSTGSVVLRAWNRLEVRRFRWDISVVLNGGPVAKGRSQPLIYEPQYVQGKSAEYAQRLAWKRVSEMSLWKLLCCFQQAAECTWLEVITATEYCSIMPRWTE
ncbi:unnamed protein product [Notodromas monacha]|uniref:EGF-like domain-containing protein n=1 Tax=Notodromas monacha TaxID=399045 RepID=A0A7R9GH95_9CRUS|nr:unnamed protein product [Notodromas monacha]CAG0921241.1 unnamed protein product [Notodromas monacha]